MRIILSRTIKRLLIIFALLTIMVSALSCSASFSYRGGSSENKKVVNTDRDELNEYSEVIGRLYGTLKILSLDRIPYERYNDYQKFVKDAAAYVVVHPSYYVFFHDYNRRKIVVERNRGEFSKNIVDMFIDEYPTGDGKYLNNVKEMVRRERDFLRSASSKQKLVIMVLPPNYKNHPEYPYKNLDEFGRYINEVTGHAPSVIYIESENFKHGRLTSDTLLKLNIFLQAAGVKRLFLGGGYVELCLDEFQKEVEKIQTIERIEIVKSISISSPDYMSDDG